MKILLNSIQYVTLGVSSLPFCLFRFAGIMTIIIIILDQRIHNVNSKIVIGTINRNGTMTGHDTEIAIQPMTIGESHLFAFLSLSEHDFVFSSFRIWTVSMIAIHQIGTKIDTIPVDQVPAIMIATITIRIRTTSTAAMATTIAIQFTSIR